MQNRVFLKALRMKVNPTTVGTGIVVEILLKNSINGRVIVFILGPERL
jgi:hypothetical protein